MDGVPFKRIAFRFFEAESGAEPVRAWLLSLSAANRKIVGEALQTVEYGWPIGMPICRPLAGHKGLWEVRTGIGDGQIARVLFCIKDGEMIGLHGFVKKTRKTPPYEIALAVKRMKGL